MKPIKNSAFLYELLTGVNCWSDLGGAFHTVTEAVCEQVIDEESSDSATHRSYVAANRPEFVFEGVYAEDDAVITYLFEGGRYFGIMNSRKTRLRITTPDARCIECPVNITEIKRLGGSAGDNCAVRLKLVADGTVMASG